MALSRRRPAQAVVGHKMSLEEFLELPEEKPYLELREGMVTRKVSPQEQHSLLEYGLSEWINRFGRPRKLAIALPELRGTYGTSLLVPDLVVYRWDRLNLLPSGKVANVYAGSPDVVIEILSFDQSLHDLADKCLIYIRHGVPIVLLINPAREWVRRFGLDGTDRMLRGDDWIDLESVLPGVELTVGKVFETLLP
jgi:Uma2 family endonuclease